MLHEKFFISDTHFWHTNIIKFLDKNGNRTRPFKDLYTMHNHIVNKWNSVVGPNDYVYHLGDVTFQYHRAFVELMYSLNGRKRLMPGNHDKIWNQHLIRCFEKCDYWKGFKEHNFTATHMPHRLDGLRDGAYNVHGHTHQNSLSDPHYINVCVEVRDYTPVHLDTILQEILNNERKQQGDKKMTENNITVEDFAQAHQELSDAAATDETAAVDAQFVQLTEDVETAEETALMTQADDTQPF